MGTLIYSIYVIGYIGLFIWGLYLAKKNGFTNIQNVILLVILALVYDNLIIALGSAIGEGILLEKLSFPRYWMHALFTPMLILFAWSVCNRARLSWAADVKWVVLAWLLTIGLIIYEFITSVVGLQLEPTWKNGILTYDSVGQAGNPFMVMVITLLLLIAGLLLFKKERFPWLFIGTILMIIGGFLAIWFKDSPVTNGFEFLLMLSILLTKRFQDETL